YALVKLSDHQVRAATDADDAQWFAAAAAPSMPFDHDELLNCAYHRLQNKVRYQPIGFELLPEKFTLSQLQTMYEAILQRPLDKRNFRKKILAMDLLAGLDEYDRDGPHRPAQLFRFDRERYERLTENGFNFEI
ncbi:MAG: NUDIX hydrolase, partial [Pirellulaceae bacterium]|nr:NUDIX hydrolase [Pirellulaceae bacterium]